MTLEQWRTQFYSLVSVTLRAQLKEVTSMFPPDDATAKLNIGGGILAHSYLVIRAGEKRGKGRDKGDLPPR